MIGYWGYLNFEVNSDWWQYPANIERTAAARYKTYYPANSPETSFSRRGRRYDDVHNVP